MPYIHPIRKAMVENTFNQVKQELKPGDLNYLFTQEMIRLWKENPCYQTLHELHIPRTFSNLYQKLNSLGHNQLELDIILEEAYMEFYRRVGQHYEDNKAMENGDVYKNVPFANDLARAVQTVTNDPTYPFGLRCVETRTDDNLQTTPFDQTISEDDLQYNQDSWKDKGDSA